VIGCFQLLAKLKQLFVCSNDNVLEQTADVVYYHWIQVLWQKFQSPNLQGQSELSD